MVWVALCSLLGGLAGASQSVDVPLTFHRMTVAEASRAPMRMSFVLQELRNDWDRSIKLPASLAKGIKSHIYISDTKTAVVAIADPDSERYKQVWVDWNHDKKVQSDEIATYKGHMNGSYWRLEYPHPPKGPKGPIYIDLLVAEQRNLGVADTAYYGGDVRLGSMDAKVEVTDNNFNGVFGDKNQFIGDGVKLVDKKPNGVTEYFSFGSRFSRENDYFSLQFVTKPKPTLSFVRDTTPRSKIALKGGQLVSLSLRELSSDFNAIIDKDQAIVPIGKYRLGYFVVKRKAKDGREYTLSLQPEIMNHEVEVEEGTVAEVSIESEPVLRLAESADESSHQFRLSCVLKNGLQLTGINYPGEHGVQLQPKPPHLVIVDPDGQEVSMQSLEYG